MSRGQVALVIFEWDDSKYLGVSPTGKPVENDWAEDVSRRRRRRQAERLPRTHYKMLTARPPLQRVYICTVEAEQAGLCSDAELGQFLKSSTAPEQTSIYTASVKFDPVPSASSSGNDLQQYSAGPYRYEVQKTGYYCVGTVPVVLEGAKVTTEFLGVVDFENVFEGALPANEYPKIAVSRVLA